MPPQHMARQQSRDSSQRHPALTAHLARCLWHRDSEAAGFLRANASSLALVQRGGAPDGVAQVGGFEQQRHGDREEVQIRVELAPKAFQHSDGHDEAGEGGVDLDVVQPHQRRYLHQDVPNVESLQVEGAVGAEPRLLHQVTHSLAEGGGVHTCMLRRIVEHQVGSPLAVALCDGVEGEHAIPLISRRKLHHQTRVHKPERRLAPPAGCPSSTGGRRLVHDVARVQVGVHKVIHKHLGGRLV
mmetsp:Transcript_17914/g.58580  ORF Transcript_17914/g.58580 Transcript_17914/m.58580 type:complete len:242 (-) Transcript_17914:85-810(-)